MQLKTIECLDPATVNVPSLSKTEDEATGETTFNFSVSASYVPYAVEGGIVSELEGGASEEVTE